MKKLLRFLLEDGTSILVEENEPLSESELELLEENDKRRRASLNIPETAKNIVQVTTEISTRTFESAIGGCINPVAKAIIANVKKLDEVPSEVEVKFGVKISADVSFIASVNTETNCEVTLKWKKDEIV